MFVFQEYTAGKVQAVVNHHPASSANGQDNWAASNVPVQLGSVGPQQNAANGSLFTLLLGYIIALTNRCITAYIRFDLRKIATIDWFCMSRHCLRSITAKLN